MSNIDRRVFVRRSASIAGGVILAPSLSGLVACVKTPPAAPRRTIGYGALVPSTTAPELLVAEGFTCLRLSESFTPSSVRPTFIVPPAFDGMAAFAMPNGRMRLVRNHEMRDTAAAAVPLGDAARSYDARGGGGTTTLELTTDATGAVTLVAEFVSLSGTIVNCAGGPTPWGSWISCEESTAGPSHGYAQQHGYCFEVPASSDVEVTPVPLKAMGRFVHEACAVDPATGYVYLTEDASYDPAAGRPGAGFYRFKPASPGKLAAGGTLQALAIRDAANYVTASGQSTTATLATTWVDIADPDPAGAEADSAAVFKQALATGAAIFQRLEGCWYGDGNIYFNATSGGNAKAGQVWAFRPGPDEGGTLRLIFESPSSDVLNAPDNICVSPRGGLVLCEDGGGVQFVRGLSRQGVLFDLVRTAAASTEFAGACFSPNGRTLFFNIQGSTSRTGTVHGGTYALWGPWEHGSL